ncbi:MAG: hypothetical protein NW241_01020 [Bacteroidia bacterium]|nr:hypothetical protein [Bacteroidia bacterium]
MEITGTVTYVPLSGGFWGIEGADGQKYTPSPALPGRFCAEGLRIKARVQPVMEFNIFMWGQTVSVEHIERA